MRYWGVGNEPWGCGGNFTPEEYATEFRRYTAWVPKFGVPLKFIAAGPNGGDREWTTRFFRTLTSRGQNALNDVFGWALHYYSGSTGDRNAIQFSTDDWYDLLIRADRMESLVTQHWAAMAESDPTHKVKLIVDEWGAWHAGSADLPANYLWAYPGIAARRAGRRADARHLQPPRRQDRDGQRRAAREHDPFAVPRAGGQVHGDAELPRVRDVRGPPGRAVGAHGVVGSRDRPDPRRTWPGALGTGRLRIAARQGADRHRRQPARDRCARVRDRGAGAAIREGRATVLSSTDLRAHNSFEHPAALAPVEAPVRPTAGSLTHRFPAASVTRLQLTLA